MTRVIQPAGTRGSLKWIQRAINTKPEILDRPVLAGMGGASHIQWLSPLAADDFAEYRDGDFLKVVGLSRLTPALETFWPRRGPQWDALAISDKSDIILVEAKAHIAELNSPPSMAGTAAAQKIRAALDAAALAFGVAKPTRWWRHYYQFANRLAHLHFLRSHGVRAWLVLVNFLGDSDMRGPSEPALWEAEYEKAMATLGIASTAAPLQHVLHVYPDVAAIG